MQNQVSEESDEESGQESDASDEQATVHTLLVPPSIFGGDFSRYLGRQVLVVPVVITTVRFVGNDANAGQPFNHTATNVSRNDQTNGCRVQIEKSRKGFCESLH